MKIKIRQIDTNRTRAKHGYMYNTSTFWSSIYEKLSNIEAELTKTLHLKKRVTPNVVAILTLLLVLGSYFIIWKLFAELSITVTSIFEEIYFGNFGKIKRESRFGLILVKFWL